MRHRKLHPVTADMRRELSVAALAKAGAFRAPHGMQFPFQHLESAHDHIRVFRVGRKIGQSPQIVPIEWRQMHFGWRPYFICPRCHARREYLYHDGICCYCRCCGDLRYLSQRKRARSRLLIRSHRIRVKLGDETGKPGQQFPPRLFNQKQRGYDKAIAALIRVEQRYLHMTAFTHRDRDERGCFVAAEHDAQSFTDEGEE
jgi:hypothetical protein